MESEEEMTFKHYLLIYLKNKIFKEALRYISLSKLKKKKNNKKKILTMSISLQIRYEDQVIVMKDIS